MKSMYKRQFAVLITLAFLLLLAACGKSVEERWQEQYDLGQKYLAELDYEQAIISFTNAIEIDPNQANAYVGRAEAYGKQNDYAAAISDYSSALEMEQNNIDWYAARGDAYIAAGNTDHALADYEHILTVDPTNRKAQEAATELREMYFETLVADGKLDEAMRYIDDKDLPESEMTDFVAALKRVAETVPPIFSEEDMYKDIQMLEDNSDVFEALDGTEWEFDTINYEYPDTHFMMQVFEKKEVGGAFIYLYYGEQAEGIPNGSGILISFVDDYVARGNWSNGKPNGDFIIVAKNYDYNRGYSVQSGHVVDGLWNGEIEWAFHSLNDNVMYYPQANNGYWVPLDTPDEEGMATIAVAASGNSTRSLWAYVNYTCGILGYAEGQ